ncbi:19287_t:CDS:2 [Funneliformis geosporum]|nr:19287_t:CDS:2 [Funneliformis geosporum]
MFGLNEQNAEIYKIDNNLTVEKLGDEIRKVWKDLLHKNFDLYNKDFAQANHALVSTVNSDPTEKRRGKLMEPSQKISS